MAIRCCLRVAWKRRQRLMTSIIRVSGSPGYLQHHALSCYRCSGERSGQPTPCRDLFTAGYMARTLAKVLPEPQASLAEAIFLGIRGTMPLTLKTISPAPAPAHLLQFRGRTSVSSSASCSAWVFWVLGRRITSMSGWLGDIVVLHRTDGHESAGGAGRYHGQPLPGGGDTGQAAGCLSCPGAGGGHNGRCQPVYIGNASFQLSFLAMSGLVFLYRDCAIGPKNHRSGYRRPGGHASHRQCRH